MSQIQKVVHLTTVHSPYDTRIFHKECSSLQRAGYNVTLIAPMDKKKTLKNTEVSIIPIKKRKNRLSRMIFTTLQAYRVAKKIKADFYHIHDPELLLVARLLKRKQNIVIYDIHEDYVTSILQKKYIFKPIRRLIAFLYGLMETLLSSNMELCLAEKYYKIIYPLGKCILNYHLLNDTLINHQVDYEHVGNKLLYTGNVSVERGAFIHAKLPRIDDRISVHFIGKCPKEVADKIYNCAGDTSDRISIKGIDRFIEREEIDTSYTNHKWLAGIALFPPSQHYMNKELTKFFEYMGAGLPIICSNFPVWESFIKKYDCGIAVDPNNDMEIKQAIHFLKSHPNKAREMGLNGKEAVIQYLNWSTEEKKLIHWYKQLFLKRFN